MNPYYEHKESRPFTEHPNVGRPTGGLDSFSCPHGPASYDPLRHCVAVFADQDAVESRMATVNDAVASAVPKRLQRAIRRSQSRSGDHGDDGVAR